MPSYKATKCRTPAGRGRDAFRCCWCFLGEELGWEDFGRFVFHPFCSSFKRWIYVTMWAYTMRISGSFLLDHSPTTKMISAERQSAGPEGCDRSSGSSCIAMSAWHVELLWVAKQQAAGSQYVLGFARQKMHEKCGGRPFGRFPLAMVFWFLLNLGNPRLVAKMGIGSWSNHLFN